MSKKSRFENRQTRTEKVQQMRATQKREQRRTRLVTAVAATLAVASIIAGVWVGVNAQKSTNTGTTPANVSASDAYVVKAPKPHSDGTTPVKVEMYEDFQCPVCGNFERTAGAVIGQLVDAGTITADYHVMSFLGPESDRAASAAGCAADEDKFRQFHNELYANQPEEGTGGYTSYDLRQAGRAVGLTDTAFVNCVNNHAYAKFATRVNTDAAKRGVTATPTIFIDGTKFSYNGSPAPLKAAIEKAYQVDNPGAAKTTMAQNPKK